MSIIGLILLLSSYPFFLLCLKKNWIEVAIHPYTKKEQTGSLFYEFSRCYYLVLAGLFLWMVMSFMLAFVVTLVALFAVWKFNRFNKKAVSEQIIIMWEETPFSYSAKGWLKKRIKTTKLVITDKWVYLNKNVRLSSTKQSSNVFQLIRITKTKQEIIFTYGYLGVPIRFVLVEIPKNTPNETLKKLDKWVKEKSIN